jgi:two-component system sensor histidine kinase and response regulator WspE
MADMSASGGGSGDFSLMDLFRTEVDGQLNAMSEALLALEQDPTAAEQLDSLMRAAHSIKGAARMVDVGPVVRIAHVLEDCFVAAQKQQISLGSGDVDTMFRAIDLIARLANIKEDGGEGQDQEAELEAAVAAVTSILQGGSEDAAVGHDTAARDEGQSSAGAESDLQQPGDVDISEPPPTAAEMESPSSAAAVAEPAGHDRVIRVSSERMDKILGLAGEAMVESRWIRPFVDSITRLKQHTHQVTLNLDNLREILEGYELDSRAMSLLSEVRSNVSECRQVLSERLSDLADFDYRNSDLTERLHNEVISSRMRPFSDGVEGLQRMVRDLARSLGKEARLEISGLHTLVDRDVLEKIKTPLNHLLRNGIDHGIESPQEREKLGKPACGQIHIEAYHRAGMLSITIQDDGQGINLEALRDKIMPIWPSSCPRPSFWSSCFYPASVRGIPSPSSRAVVWVWMWCRTWSGRSVVS